MGKYASKRRRRLGKWGPRHSYRRARKGEVGFRGGSRNIYSRQRDNYEEDLDAEEDEQELQLVS
jgi:hypothetical protein